MNFCLLYAALKLLSGEEAGQMVEGAVLFYEPFDRLTAHARSVYEELASEYNFTFGLVDCYDNRELCMKLQIYTFPSVIAYHLGYNFTYNGMIEPHLLRAYLAKVFANSLRDDHITGDHFEIHSSAGLNREEQLFAEFKFWGSFRYVRSDERRLVAIVNNSRVEYNGDFSENSVERFVYQYHQHFPVLNGSNYKLLKEHNLAIFVHNQSTLRPLEIGFPDNGMIYVQMSSSRFGAFATEAGCMDFPCALVLVRNGLKYVKNVASFREYLGFVADVSGGLVAPAERHLPSESSSGRPYLWHSVISSVKSLGDTDLFTVVKLLAGCLAIIGTSALAGIIIARTARSSEHSVTGDAQSKPHNRTVRRQESALNVLDRGMGASNAFTEPMMDRATSSMSAIAPDGVMGAHDSSSLEISGGHTVLSRFLHGNRGRRPSPTSETSEDPQASQSESERAGFSSGSDM